MHASSKCRVAIATLAVSLLVACASKPTIRANADPGADFSRYRTFGFFDEAMGKKAAYESFSGQYIKDAIGREMQLRGFQHATDEPDLLINIHVQTKDKVKVTESPSGYYGYRSGMYGWGTGVYTTVDNYTEGTLNIDIIDRSASKLLWEGIAVGRISEKSRENLQPAIDAVVKQVFERFQKLT